MSVADAGGSALHCQKLSPSALRRLVPVNKTSSVNGLSFLLAQLPGRTETAAANMADDNLLVENTRPGTLWLRFYGWSEPAFSFGVFQNLAWIRTQLPPGAENLVLVRRPTGGGLVDHRCDWTYTLVVPAGHPLADGPAIETYRLVHGALAESLAELDVATGLVPCAKACGLPSAPATAPTVCFQRPETYDVLELAAGRKIAGAALRRIRAGLLLQGSVDASGLGRVKRARFESAFARKLAALAVADLAAADWPFPGDDPRRAAETARFASKEWTARR